MAETQNGNGTELRMVRCDPQVFELIHRTRGRLEMETGKRHTYADALRELLREQLLAAQK